MPTNRKRLRRDRNDSITPELIEKFREWRELDDRRGTKASKEDIFLTGEEESRYWSLAREIHNHYRWKPWEGGMCYSMWGRNKHPEKGEVLYCETSVKRRLQLEEALKQGWHQVLDMNTKLRHKVSHE